MHKRLRTTRQTNPSEYWKILTADSVKPNSEGLSLAAFARHFATLSSSTDEVTDDPKLTLTQTLERTLHSRRSPEINQAIKTIKRAE